MGGDSEITKATAADNNIKDAASEAVISGSQSKMLEDAQGSMRSAVTRNDSKGDKNTTELDFEKGTSVERTERNDPSAKQVADSMIKNGGFGRGEDRRAVENSLADAMKKGEGKEHVQQINDELKAAGSKIKVTENITGGGGSGSREVNGVKVETSSSSAEGRFVVHGNAGQKDAMNIQVGSSEIRENGIVVGQHSYQSGDKGGGASGWGKTGGGSDATKGAKDSSYAESYTVGPGMGSKGGGRKGGGGSLRN